MKLLNFCNICIVHYVLQIYNDEWIVESRRFNSTNSLNKGCGLRSYSLPLYSISFLSGGATMVFLGSSSLTFFSFMIKANERICITDYRGVYVTQFCVRTYEWNIDTYEVCIMWVFKLVKHRCLKYLTNMNIIQQILKWKAAHCAWSVSCQLGYLRLINKRHYCNTKLWFDISLKC